MSRLRYVREVRRASADYKEFSCRLVYGQRFERTKRTAILAAGLELPRELAGCAFELHDALIACVRDIDRGGRYGHSHRIRDRRFEIAQRGFKRSPLVEAQNP